jgi:hypothetical protein
VRWMRQNAPELLQAEDVSIAIVHGRWQRIAPRARGIASRATACHKEMREFLPEELSAAGLMVPEPSVTPKPLVACAEYMAAPGARREGRHGFRDALAAAIDRSLQTRSARPQRRRISMSVVVEV